MDDLVERLARKLAAHTSVGGCWGCSERRRWRRGASPLPVQRIARFYRGRGFSQRAGRPDELRLLAVLRF